MNNLETNNKELFEIVDNLLEIIYGFLPGRIANSVEVQNLLEKVSKLREKLND